MKPVHTLQRGLVPDRLDTGLTSWALRWETLLLAVAAAIFTFNALSSEYFLDPWNLSDATFNFTEKAIISLAMALLIIAGEIDLSVASIIALCSVAMGAAAQAGFGTPELILVGILTGACAGALNGVLVTGLGLPSIVVTIGTMSLFRGIAYVVLGDGVYKGYPSSFAYLGQGYVWWVIPFQFVLFLFLAVIFAVVLHKTVFGRWIFAIGNNPIAARFSGIRVDRVKLMLFIVSGVMSGLAAILLTSRIGSTRPSIAFGWELEVVTMVVLGGVSILGGSGTIPGVLIAAFVMGLVTMGLGLLNIPGIVMSIVIGCMLIGVIALPIVWHRIKGVR